VHRMPGDSTRSILHEFIIEPEEQNESLVRWM